jgi:tetratricopeptide (TPR) repeat protein/O-antigen ligase
LLSVLLVGAPLAVGAVHRPTFLLALAISFAAGVAGLWLASRGREDFRPHLALALPIALVLIALAQVVPLPAGLRAALDPAGAQLLALAGIDGVAPMSLDPPATHAQLGKAGAALCVALAALVLASGRRLRLLAPRLVAAAGLAAMAIGLGHRALGEGLIYGRLSGGGGLLLGPFVNPNHQAEFLELAAFAALAAAFASSTRDQRRVWKLVAVVLAAGALATLSRGSVLALAAAGLVWLAWAPRAEEGEAPRRQGFVAVLLGVLALAGATIGLGGDAIVNEFRGDGGGLSKPALWQDALEILRAHPLGIGLGAFSRVYPVYQTVPSPVRFEFTENELVGLLIEGGIPGLLLALAALVACGRLFQRGARKDKVEASLLAALAAVLAHNLVDFGLQAPGIFLPFAALLGTVMGRQLAAAEPRPARKPSASVAGVAPASVAGLAPASVAGVAPASVAGLAPASVAGVAPASVAGVASVAGLALVAVAAGAFLVTRPAARDFDALLAGPDPAGAAALARAASLAHPTDYYYALAQATFEPLAPPGAATQPRLRQLNRAMILCPLCLEPHRRAARDLWRLGRRPQALLEWRTFVADRPPGALSEALDELARAGATPDELASLADEKNRLELCWFFINRGMLEPARAALAQAAKHDGSDYQLARAAFALAGGDLAAAEQASRRALELAPRDPRAHLTAATVALRARQTEPAIQHLRQGIRFEPRSLELHRKLIAVLMETGQWRAAEHALEGLRAALLQNGQPLAEANIAAARIFEQRGEYRRAMSEYRAALTVLHDDIGLQLALAKTAAASGNITAAVDAYNEVLRRSPENAEARAGLDRIHGRQGLLEALTAPAPGTAGE